MDMSEKEKDFVEENEMSQNTDNTSDVNNTGEAENAAVKDDKKDGKSSKKRKSSRSKKKDDELKKKIEELEEEKAGLNEKYLRLYSEFDNYRKRTIKEKAELYKTAAEDTILAMLPVVDDFERALKAAGDSEKDSAHKEGMELIYNKLINILKNKGVETIEDKEVDFDLDIHEAITKIPAPSEELKNKVVDVVEKGYKLNGKVIRFAKVVIGE
jgi:molecular chaperone GrpE